MRRRAIRAALHAAHAFQQEHYPLCAYTLAAVCLSHAEGLDVVAAGGGGQFKQDVVELAQALVPGLRLGAAASPPSTSLPGMNWSPAVSLIGQLSPAAGVGVWGNAEQPSVRYGLWTPAGGGVGSWLMLAGLGAACVAGFTVVMQRRRSR